MSWAELDADLGPAGPMPVLAQSRGGSVRLSVAVTCHCTSILHRNHEMLQVSYLRFPESNVCMSSWMWGQQGRCGANRAGVGRSGRCGASRAGVGMNGFPRCFLRSAVVTALAMVEPALEPRPRFLVCSWALVRILTPCQVLAGGDRGLPTASRVSSRLAQSPPQLLHGRFHVCAGAAPCSLRMVAGRGR